MAVYLAVELHCSAPPAHLAYRWDVLGTKKQEDLTVLSQAPVLAGIVAPNVISSASGGGHA